MGRAWMHPGQDRLNEEQWILYYSSHDICPWSESQKRVIHAASLGTLVILPKSSSYEKTHNISKFMLKFPPM